MPRYERFTFACDAEERRILAALARRLERSQSDALRLLIRSAAQELGTDSTPIPATSKPAVRETPHVPAPA